MISPADVRPLMVTGIVAICNYQTILRYTLVKIYINENSIHVKIGSKLFQILSLKLRKIVKTKNNQLTYTELTQFRTKTQPTYR